MAVGNSEGGDETLCDMNTTPLIDVMLVLLVMLIVTIPIQTHAVKLDLPPPTNTPPPPPDQQPVVINLEVDFDGTIMWNGNVVPDQDTMMKYLASSAASNPQPEIHLRPNRLAKYDTVAKILAWAQRIGVKRIGFVGNEQFLQ